MKRGICIGALVAGLGAGMALAGPEIGQVKQAIGDARILRAGAVIPATLGLGLEQADVIETGADGAIGMTFSDNSRMSLGPKSRLALEKYSFTPGAKGAFDARLSSGSLTAASGEIAKLAPESMRVLMPTTILGVRGTEFAVRVPVQ